VVLQRYALWIQEAQKPAFEQQKYATKPMPPLNTALHTTPVNVAKICDYNHSFRVAEHGAVVVGRL